MYLIPNETEKTKKFVIKAYPAAKTAGSKIKAKIFLKNLIVFYLKKYL
jgi:hypothetical protein